MRYDLDSLNNRDPAVIERALWLAQHVLTPYHRAEVEGVERIPDGAALYVGNHNSGAYTPETWLFASAVYRTHGLDAVPYGLAHEVAISLPIAHEIMLPLGAVRASHENAKRLFASQKKVLVYPGGDVESMRAFRHRNRIMFAGRRGYVRLALRSGVPIVPFVSHGAHSTLYVIDDGRWIAEKIGANRWLRLKAWPISLAIPWGLIAWPLFPFVPFPSKIRIEVMEPIDFERSGPEAADDDDYVRECATRVESAMQSTLTRLAAEAERR